MLQLLAKPFQSFVGKKKNKYIHRTHEEMNETFDEFNLLMKQVDSLGNVFFREKTHEDYVPFEEAYRSWKKARIAANKCINENQSLASQVEMANACRLYCFETKEHLFECNKTLVNFPVYKEYYDQLNAKLIPWLQSFSEEIWY